jgi:hypothetical protein
MFLDQKKTDYLRGKDLYCPNKRDYTELYLYLRGQNLARITTGNVDTEATRLDQYLDTRDISTGVTGLTHDFDKISSQLKKIGLTVEKYVDVDQYKKETDVYRNLIGDRINAFRKDLYEYYGVTDNPKADAVYDKAYDRGHSAGIGEVSSIFGDLVDLIVD